MEKAFKGGKSAKADDFMQNLAHEHGLSDANAAYRQLAEADEFHRAQLKEVKDASSQRGE